MVLPKSVKSLFSRTNTARLVIILLLLSIGTFLTKGLERPFWRFTTIANKQQRAAFAVRDNVVAFQKWGTKLYTLPYLEKYYQDVFYVTQFSQENNEEQFIDNLTRALTNYEQVDIFILAHGNRMVNWVAKIPAPLRARIRMVYNTGCTNSCQYDQWLSLGAKTYVGHPGAFGQGALFYFFFLRRWTNDTPANLAITDCNQLIHSVINKEIYIPGVDIDPDTIYQMSEAQCYGNCQLKLSD